MTKQPLKKPIVACRLGFLYNKENVLKALIEKSIPKKFEHIASLKDIVDVNIDENKKQDATFPFVCPVSQTEFNGLNRFILLWSCGCAISERAFNETKNIEKNKCLVCHTPFKSSDIVSLNMTPQEQDKIKKEIIQKREEKVRNMILRDNLNRKLRRRKPKRAKREKKMEIKKNIKVSLQKSSM